MVRHPGPFASQDSLSSKKKKGATMPRVCDWGRTHIAVEGKHKEWRDHRTNLNVAVSRAEVTSEPPWRGPSQSVSRPPVSAPPALSFAVSASRSLLIALWASLVCSGIPDDNYL